MRLFLLENESFCAIIVLIYERNDYNMADKILMRNWDDWFNNCNDASKNLALYEDKMWDFYCIQYSKYQAKQKGEEYALTHNIKFYNSFPDFPKHKTFNLVRHSVLSMVIGFLLGFIFKLIASYGKMSISLTYAMFTGILACLIGGGFGYLITIFKTKSLKNELSKLENNIKESISYIPPKYRNSIATGYIFNDYMTFQGVLTFNQALLDVDNWLAQLPLSDGQSIGRSIACLFDVPYASTGFDGDNIISDTAADRGLYEVTSDNPALSNPNLPDDIRSKTYKGLDNADVRLSNLIGLNNVKSQIQQMKNRMEFYGQTNSASDKISGNHMCFLGAAGTGKTTVARIITRILYDFGYIKENKCVEIDGTYLKSPYVGQTGARVEAIINYALGGVLFIDEAYLMLDSKSSAGIEATGVLLKYMEDYKNDFVVIFAGYEDDVNRLLSFNEGFASRIKQKIYFEDFTTDELMQIFKSMCTNIGDKGYILSPVAEELLYNQFDHERMGLNFGNARAVRNALDKIMDIHADHFMKQEIPEIDKFVFTELDIKTYIEIKNKQLSEDARNFMASKGLDNSIVSFAELKSRTKDGSSNPDEDLNNLIGLDVVKDEIKQLKAQFEFYKGDKQKIQAEGHHMTFVGPPGTGKTTVASIMTAYLYEMGIIRQNKYLDVNGDFLRGQYLGHTGKRTEAVVAYSQGMVLFIDEAYLLQQDDKGDSFGQEAIGVLLDAMEKNRKSFVVIFAGYEKEMNVFLNANSGLRSRISQTFHFKSYSPFELAKMMKSLAKKDGFKVEKDVWHDLQVYLKTRVSEPHFGNARFIRSFWEETKKQHILNYSKGNYLEDYKFIITLDDINAVCALNLQAET